MTRIKDEMAKVQKKIKLGHWQQTLNY